ncbi:MAG: hypothetical protein M0R16_13230, partial [Bacteroidales bacterium]|nr:hypothetical protein [Bacteroidales bacterium]
EGGCGSGSSIGSGNSVTITRSLTSNTTYYCRWESNSCGNSGCASATVTVISNPTAPTSVSVSPSTICSGTSTDYTLTYTGGDAGGSGGKFYWYEGSCGGTPVAS